MDEDQDVTLRPRLSRKEIRKDIALSEQAAALRDPVPPRKITFDRRFVAILKGAYLAADRAPTVAQMATELADWSGHSVEKASAYLARMMQYERWHVQRDNYWEELARRARETSMEQTLEVFEQRLIRNGMQMINDATEALAIHKPQNVTEAVLLYKLGMDATLRGHKAPQKYNRAVEGPASGEGSRIMEAEFQDMSEDEYEAAARADYAKLASSVGTDPAPGRSDD